MTGYKAQVVRLIEDLRRVTKWGRMHSFAAKHGLPASRTWDPFLEAILGDNVTEKALATVAQQLETFYQAQLLSGDRIVSFFAPHATLGAKLFAMAKKATAPENVVSKNFPALLPVAKEKDVPTVPTFAGKIVKANGDIALFFVSGRYVEERTKYKASEVTAAVRNAFAGYDEFIAIRRTFRQCVDSVVVSPVGAIEVRLDLPTLTNMDYAELCAKTLLEHFHRYFSGPNSEPMFGQRRNLFGAINKIYRKTGLGKVSELGFETPTDSVKLEKMRDRTSDLRTELYHTSGKKGLGNLADIVPYRLAVRFPTTIGTSSIELTLPGSFRELAKPSQHLEIAAITGCLSEDDFDETVRKLVAHL